MPQICQYARPIRVIFFPGAHSNPGYIKTMDSSLSLSHPGTVLISLNRILIDLFITGLHVCSCSLRAMLWCSLAGEPRRACPATYRSPPWPHMLGWVKLCGYSKVFLTVPGWFICIPFWTTQGADIHTCHLAPHVVNSI